METVKKFKLHVLVQSIVMIAIGIVLVVWTKASLDIMAKALAVLLLLIGLVFIVNFVFRKEKTFVPSAEFVVGILVAAVGGWIFLNPGPFTDFIPKLFGIFIIVSGLGNLGQTISLIKYKAKTWWISLLIALVTVGLGAFLVFNPTEAKEIAVSLIGVFLIIDGVTNLINIIMVIIAASQAEKDEEALVSTAEVVSESPVEKEPVEVVEAEVVEEQTELENVEATERNDE
jgi:uncharacterized membrane protein HdeD (DUF308 family)